MPRKNSKKDRFGYKDNNNYNTTKKITREL